MSHGFARLAREHCDRYAVGTALDVRYDPRNPSDAVIETRIPRPSYLAVGLAAGCERQDALHVEFVDGLGVAVDLRECQFPRGGRRYGP